MNRNYDIFSKELYTPSNTPKYEETEELDELIEESRLIYSDIQFYGSGTFINPSQSIRFYGDI